MALHEDPGAQILKSLPGQSMAAEADSELPSQDSRDTEEKGGIDEGRSEGEPREADLIPYMDTGQPPQIRSYGPSSLLVS